MAFKEKYEWLLAQRRADRKPPVWSVSLGYDKTRREQPIRDAVAAGRLDASVAVKIIPEFGVSDEVRPVLDSVVKSRSLK